MTWIKLAWRNLWRNPRRTLITVFSMTFGLTMMIVAYALMDGMYAQMVRYATQLGTGHIQIHNTEYAEDRSLYDTMNDPAAILETINGTGVGAAAPRAYATALVSSGPQSAGGLMWGIEPESERRVSIFHRHLAAGEFLSGSDRGKVVVGSSLARNIGVSPGDEIIVLTQAADGSLGNALFTVKGILLSAGEMIDRGGILMPLADLDELLALDGRIHEVAVRLADPDTMPAAAAAITDVLADDSLKVRTWRQLLPELSEILDLWTSSTTISLLIIFSLAAIGIMNTQLMALFERTREVGIMRALGQSPLVMAMIVFLETVFMVIISTVLGCLAGGLWAGRLEAYGWDLSNLGGSISYQGVVFETHFYANLTTMAFTESVKVMAIIAMVATLYPVIRATRITPADAIGRGR
jgi:ABC-type lipoprotein release transport system permease subunit